MALKVEALKKVYGDFSLSLDLSVGDGETLALVGASGCGKTTALNLIAGLVEPEAGSVIIDGEDISALPAYKRNVSVVFQELALFPHLDVGANISYGLSVRGVKRNERRRIIEETLEIVHLPVAYASRKIDTLSGGERQRVAIARALASNPRALLLDEPFSSLDAPLRKSLRREFLEIRSHSKAPCIFVTHDREEAVMLGDRVALMSGGRVVECAEGRELLLSPKTEEAARFFGAGFVLPCKILGKREEGLEVSTPLGNLTAPTVTEAEYNSASPMLFVPEDAIHFEAAPTAQLKPFRARIEGSLFEGRALVLKLLLDPREDWQKPFSLELSAGRRMKAPESGARIDLWIDQSLINFVR